jgi:hypothetical protein
MFKKYLKMNVADKIFYEGILDKMFTEKNEA